MGNGGGKSGLPLENKVANQAGALGGGNSRGRRALPRGLEAWNHSSPAGDWGRPVVLGALAFLSVMYSVLDPHGLLFAALDRSSEQMPPRPWPL